MGDKVCLFYSVVVVQCERIVGGDGKWFHFAMKREQDLLSCVRNVEFLHEESCLTQLLVCISLQRLLSKNTWSLKRESVS